MKIKIILLCIFVSSSIKCSFSETIVVQTLSELRRSGWSISGSTPSTYEKPGSWKATLRPLDDGVNGGETWRVTSSNPTIFKFVRNGDLCYLNNVSIKVRYFSESTVFRIFPCESPLDSQYCYGNPGNEVAWQDKHVLIDSAELASGFDIELSVTVLSGGYIFFDQVIIEHDGIPCSLTTENPVTSDEPSTTPDIPSTTSKYTDISETPTTSNPECPSTTLAPEPCDCCDRCAKQIVQEIHHHHYYYYPPSFNGNKSMK